MSTRAGCVEAVGVADRCQRDSIGGGTTGGTVPVGGLGAGMTTLGLGVGGVLRLVVIATDSVTGAIGLGTGEADAGATATAGVTVAAVSGGTTESAGRSGGGGAAGAGGLSPRSSAFWDSNLKISSFTRAMLSAASARVPVLSLCVLWA